MSRHFSLGVSFLRWESLVSRFSPFPGTRNKEGVQNSKKTTSTKIKIVCHFDISWILVHQRPVGCFELQIRRSFACLLGFAVSRTRFSKKSVRDALCSGFWAASICKKTQIVKIQRKQANLMKFGPLMERLEAAQTGETVKQGFSNCSKELSGKSLTKVFFSSDYGTIENNNICPGEKTLHFPNLPQIGP